MMSDQDDYSGDEDSDYYHMSENDDPVPEKDEKLEDPEYFNYEVMKPAAAQQMLHQTVQNVATSLKLHWSLTEMLLVTFMWDEKVVKLQCERDYLKALTDAHIIPQWASEESTAQSNNNHPPASHMFSWPLQSIVLRDTTPGKICQCCYTEPSAPATWDQVPASTTGASPMKDDPLFPPLIREDLTHLYSLLCGSHFFCLPCWRLYLHHQLHVASPCGNQTPRCFECMGHRCQVRVPHAFALWVLQEARLVCDDAPPVNIIPGSGLPCHERYAVAMLRDLVQSHPHMRLCPTRHCNNVFCAIQPLATKRDIWCCGSSSTTSEGPKSPPGNRGTQGTLPSSSQAVVVSAASGRVSSSLRVQCPECGKEACFLCGAEYHAPTDCETLVQWTRKCLDDSETANYISAHTKDCPKCHVCIEKSGGCNHMNCAKCGHNFCWMCLGDWKAHSAEYYECSRYRENPNIANEAQHVLARKALKKYIFYYERWANHEKSLRLEHEQSERIRHRINQKVNQKEGTWIDWQYLLTASHTLRRCRNTLKHTYPFAFYMDRGPHMNRKELFEYKQGLLEAEVENLSWKIEHAEIHDRGGLEQKMDVCEKHRKALLHEFFIP